MSLLLFLCGGRRVVVAVCTLFMMTITMMVGNGIGVAAVPCGPVTIAQATDAAQYSVCTSIVGDSSTIDTDIVTISANDMTATEWAYLAGITTVINGGLTLSNTDLSAGWPLPNLVHVDGYVSITQQLGDISIGSEWNLGYIGSYLNIDATSVALRSLNLTITHATSVIVNNANSVYATGVTWPYFGVHGLNSTGYVTVDFGTVLPDEWVMPDLTHADQFLVRNGAPTTTAMIMADVTKPSSIGSLIIKCSNVAGLMAGFDALHHVDAISVTYCDSATGWNPTSFGGGALTTLGSLTIQECSALVDYAPFANVQSLTSTTSPSSIEFASSMTNSDNYFANLQSVTTLTINGAQLTSFNLTSLVTATALNFYTLPSVIVMGFPVLNNVTELYLPFIPSLLYPIDAPLLTTLSYLQIRTDIDEWVLPSLTTVGTLIVDAHLSAHLNMPSTLAVINSFSMSCSVGSSNIPNLNNTRSISIMSCPLTSLTLWSTTIDVLQLSLCTQLVTLSLPLATRINELYITGLYALQLDSDVTWPLLTNVTIMNLQGFASSVTLDSNGYFTVMPSLQYVIDTAIITAPASPLDTSIRGFHFPSLLYIGTYLSFPSWSVMTTFSAPQCTYIRRLLFGDVSTVSTTAITTIHLPRLTTVGYSDYNSNAFSFVSSQPSLTNLTLPSLTTVIGNLKLLSSSALATVSLPSLTNVYGDLIVSSMDSLSTIAWPSLVNITGSLRVYSLGALTTISLPQLVYIGRVFSVLLCGSLTTISLPLWRGPPIITEDTIYAEAGLALDTLPSLVLFSVPQLQRLGWSNNGINIYFNNLDSLPTIDMPLLSFIQQGGITFSNLTSVTAINMPLLTSVPFGVTIQSLPSLVSLELPWTVAPSIVQFIALSSLVSLSLPNCSSASSVTIQNCDSLTTISFPALAYFYGDFVLQNMASLSTINLPSLVYAQTVTLIYIPLITDINWLIAPNPSGYYTWAFTGLTSLVNLAGLCDKQTSITLINTTSVCCERATSILANNLANYPYGQTNTFQGPCDATPGCTTGVNDFACTCATTGLVRCAPGAICSEPDVAAPDRVLCSACEQQTYRANITWCAPCTANSYYNGDSARDADYCQCSQGYYGNGSSGCNACPYGTYKTADGSAASCTSCLPLQNTTTTGNIYQSACGCLPGLYIPPTSSGCEPCPLDYFSDKIENSCTGCPFYSHTNSTGSTNVTQCICNDGLYFKWYGNFGSCESCPYNSYCTNSIATLCPTNTQMSVPSSSAVSITQCICVAGTYGTYDTNCTVCDTNSYCPGGTSIIACPANSSYSGTGAEEVSYCRCDAGFAGAVGSNTPCSVCPAGYRCPTGVVNTCLTGTYCPAGSIVAIACPTNTTSPLRSQSINNCTCKTGYEPISSSYDCRLSAIIPSSSSSSSTGDSHFSGASPTHSSITVVIIVTFMIMAVMIPIVG